MRRSASAGRGLTEDEDAAGRLLRRELEELRYENARLQDKLCKAKSLVHMLQRQADDARAERDREHLRAESLQRVAQELRQQLGREAAKAQLLERTLTAAAAAGASGDHSGEATPLTEVLNSVRRTREASFARPPEPPPPPAPMTTPPAEPSEPDSSPLKEQVSMSLLSGADSPVTAGPVPTDSQQLHPQLQHHPHASQGLGSERSWEFVVQGQHDAHLEQPDFAPKQLSCFPGDALQRVSSRGVAFVCTRGRRLDRSVPNQDDFVIARHTLARGGHIALYGVFDGHGVDGHLCAAYARGFLPECLFGQSSLLMRPEETLREAFRQAQQGLLQQPFDTENSGTTAALALVLNLPSLPSEPGRQPETWLFVAHVGDSRVLLASHRERDTSALSVSVLTRDHRPDNLDEAERIGREGGEIRRLRKGSGAVRVFERNQDRPALALTRSLGASGASTCGVVATPEVSAYRLSPGVDVLLVLGTDGLFEFCGNEDIATRVLADGVDDAVLEDICGEARRQWARSSYNETVDDITAVAVSLAATAPSTHGNGATLTG